MKQKNLKLAVMALCSASLAQAQSPTDSIGQRSSILNESAFTFTEAQLGEDDDMSQNVTIVNSNNNIYASEVGYLFSPVRFRYRAFDQKYNDVYINGIPMNDMETGQFRFSNIGGLNQQTKNQEFALPFESNKFAMTGMAGSNNYNFRPASMPAGHRITLTGANRNYTLRGMYTFNTGLSEKGWAFSGNITYRWANEGYVEGTFYNSLSYFLGVQKVFGNGAHSLAFSTWGNPTERASQGAGTDEMYWMANDRYYNPYWGYQNGKKRNSRIVNDFAPTALLTWDWKISDNDKLTTSLMGKYIRKCDTAFYKKLSFKPYVIKDLNDPDIDRSKLKCVCDTCGGKVVKKKKWGFVNNSFRAEFYCPNCDKNFRVSVRYKRYFDRVEAKKTFSDIAQKDRHRSKK